MKTINNPSTFLEKLKHLIEFEEMTCESAIEQRINRRSAKYTDSDIDALKRLENIISAQITLAELSQFDFGQEARQ